MVDMAEEVSDNSVGEQSFEKGEIPHGTECQRRRDSVNMYKGIQRTLLYRLWHQYRPSAQWLGSTAGDCTTKSLWN